MSAFPKVQLLDIKQTRSAGFVLSLAKPSDIARVASKWPESGIGGEAFPARARTPLCKFVIRGVDLQEDTSVIRDVLALEYGISFIENGITRMRKTKTGALLPLLLVKAIDSPNARNLIKEGAMKIGCLRLRVEEFVLQPRIIRCFKCLQYGH
jgi:hypothetical protein